MKTRILLVLIIILLLGFILLQIQGRNLFSNENTMKKINSDFTIKSSAFKDGEFIPLRFTGDGEDVNPLLEIKNTPQNAKSLALIFDDPDATGGDIWTHWVLWNINPQTQYIAEDSVPEGAITGINSWGKNSYGGPYPPKGSKPHRYFFRLYALDTVLNLPPSSNANDLRKAMEGHILDETTLMGLYSRK